MVILKFAENKNCGQIEELYCFLIQVLCGSLVLTDLNSQTPMYKSLLDPLINTKELESLLKFLRCSGENFFLLKLKLTKYH